ncbi:MAG TPA: SEL1-like repeat protein [Stellaceae bacterium]|nr:SEL1-like repeat protein [Stellaceae bacterium]
MLRILVIAGTLLVVPLAARAQFYDVDGAYHCVTAPDADCNQRLQSPAAPAVPVATTAPPKPVSVGLAEAAARVRRGEATAQDIRFVAAQAAAKEPRAIELLAWCRLNGIGTARDPVAAYWLYREAANLGLAGARENQIAIYETRLSSEERQQVLIRENDPDR